MLKLVKATRPLMMLGCAIFLTACLRVDDATGLRLLEPTIGALGHEVVRVNDAALTAAYRNLAATYVAVSPQ